MPAAFSTDTAAIVLVDHQDMTVVWIASRPHSRRASTTSACSLASAKSSRCRCR